jgi:branched-chain amino acid transport system substrate-binding protein
MMKVVRRMGHPVSLARIVAVMGALALASAVLVADATAQSKTLKIGIAISYSGKFAKEGELARQGYELFREVANEKGGLKVGNDRYLVEYKYYDDQSDQSAAANLVEKLITEDKVSYIFGPFSSDITFSTSAIGEKYRVITMAALANAEKIYTRGFKYTFGNFPPSREGLSTILTMANELTPKPHTVAIIYPDALFPFSAAKGAKDRAEQLGMKVVYFEKYPPTVKDLTPIMTQVKQLKPDIFLSAALLEEAIFAAKAYRELKINSKIMGFASGPHVPDFLSALGDTAEYTIGYGWWSPSVQLKDDFFGTAQQYTERFEKRFKERANYISAAASAAGLVLMKAIEKAGSLDVEKVRPILAATDMETFYNVIRYDKTGLNVGGFAVLMQAQKGKAVTVYPPKAAEAKVVYPMPTWEEREKK